MEIFMRCASYWPIFLHRKENIHLKASIARCCWHFCCRHVFVAFQCLHQGWMLVKSFDPLKNN